MNFLEKLDYLMKKNNLNKSSLSKACEIPYTTIDGWYKKGYEGLKLTTLRKLSTYFGTSLDFWVNDTSESITSSHPRNLFIGEKDEIELITDYRVLNKHGKALARGILKGMSISEKIAIKKGETVHYPHFDTNEFLNTYNLLEPEYQNAIYELTVQMIEDQN